MNRVQERLEIIPPELLKSIRRGVEKESLRVRPDGMLSAAAHPVALGSALTHPHITTDFSESQLELITGVHGDVDACLAELIEIHQIVYQHVGEELLWCTSMPCGLPADDEIPIGQYGSSNLGLAKTIYRRGLSHRYGRRMQTISGVHYNFSMPEAVWPILQRADASQVPTVAYQTESYFHLIRNFRRYSWLLLYLFGASPTVCKTFVAGRPHRLMERSAGTLFLPGATSLRMGPLGYQSDAQSSLAVSFNSLTSYARSLNGALTTPYPPYEALGLRRDDEYLQLGTTLLQIENEFYGTIRPKPRFRSGERPLWALGERGVDYVEVRCMDNDPFAPAGIAAQTMRTLDLFLLYCLLADSPPDTPGEIAAMSRNQHRVAERGREPGLMLESSGRERGLMDWGDELLTGFEPIATALDRANTSESYRTALAAARATLSDPVSTRSARVLEEMERGGDKSYVKFALAQSALHRRTLTAMPLAEEVKARYTAMARESFDAQKKVESADVVPFETYRREYLSRDLLSGALLKSLD